ncbi:Predicted Fe-Mo cluster-binding protein, NifX family [Anaerobranca californiensis DSM 14826]|jgi:predicted Fe-Mo cluster-binding NifX family protein|uniref:Predicted Fe-Mo cluster-binding protein, NifX family n=1 Tax=Anaerobranca californiensis DSM 14826 TaxID=1120989 RepID=A0A1M6MWN4_9FIRM|nr:NifB/NifX family molybdenum-iron cluster-binding protein [Anaerobranca californiensis]SHJ87891.1 Predicted Fe-Mo cluster-binding protein, NifX family [Anaerobranca californiensis DSM 14826]
MKIAVASEGNFVSGHFGHCQGFTIYETEGNKLLKKEFIDNPGHRPGFLPNYLKEKGVNVIISGGMGETAQQLFAQNNIEVIVGVEGQLDEIVQQYLNNQLKTTNSVCREHMHKGNCHG